MVGKYLVGLKLYTAEGADLVIEIYVKPSSTNYLRVYQYRMSGTNYAQCIEKHVENIAIQVHKCHQMLPDDDKIADASDLIPPTLRSLLGEDMIKGGLLREGYEEVDYFDQIQWYQFDDESEVETYANQSHPIEKVWYK